MTENTEVGKVKFFDHKKGYGFIEVINPESKHVNTEHFLHYSEIKCDSNFKKVIPGEIVSMTVAPKDDEEGKTVCKNVCGLFGTKLLIDSDQYTYRIRSKGVNRDDDPEPVDENDGEDN
jgi:cold shock CspA family protein